MTILKCKFTFTAVLLWIFIFTGCAIKEPQKPEAVIFTVVSPMIKISDAGFLRVYNNSAHLQIYSSGVSVLEIWIRERVCMNGACKDELVFNKDFFAREHYRGFFGDILRKKPIYEGRNLSKTECGFDQILGDITYQICEGKVSFKDRKNGVRLALRGVE